MMLLKILHLFQISDCKRHAPYLVHHLRAQPKFVHRLLHQDQTPFAQFTKRFKALVLPAFKCRIPKPLLLNLPRSRTLCRIVWLSVPRFFPRQFRIRHRRNLHMNINPIQQRPTELIQIPIPRILRSRSRSGVQRFSGTEPQELKPRVGIFSKIGMRLMISALAIAFFAWRGNVLRHEHERLSRIIGMNQDPEPGDKMARLQLAVTNVRYNQQITDDAPYYRDGGDWTVFDCSANEDSGVTFTVAIEKPKYLPPPMKMGFSQAAILPRDRESGARFISALAAALNVGDRQRGRRSRLRSRSFRPLSWAKISAVPSRDLEKEPGHGWQRAGLMRMRALKGKFTSTTTCTAPELNSRGQQLSPIQMNLRQLRQRFGMVRVRRAHR